MGLVVPFSFKSVSALDVFKRVIQEAKKEGYSVGVTSLYDPYNSSVAGLVSRVLRSLDIDTVMFDETSALQRELPLTVAVGGSSSSCRRCVVLEESSGEGSVKVGNNYVLRFELLAENVMELLSEFDIIPRDVKLVMTSAMLWRHTPRSLDKGFTESESALIEKLVKEDVIEVREGPPVMGWTHLGPAEAVRLSIDVLIPDMFMRGLEGGPDVEEVLMKAGLSSGGSKVKHFLAKNSWLAKDLYLAAYGMQWLIDTSGWGGAAASVSNKTYLAWAVQGLIASFPEIRRFLDESADVERRKLITVGGDPMKLSGGVLTKVLRGLGMLAPEGIAGVESGDRIFLPYSLLPRDVRLSLLPKGGLEGGYLAIPAREVNEKLLAGRQLT